MDAWLSTPIEVIPAVDVLDGEAVRLRQGDYDDVVERATDPTRLAARFAAAGAKRIHLVDLEGARSGGVRPGLVAIVVGTAAVDDPAPWVESLGDRVVLALDVRDGRVRTAGWTADAGLTLDEATARFVACGATRVLCTAIEHDGTLAGPDRELVARVAATGLGVLAAGGIRSPADVGALAAAGAEAAVVGRALLAAKA